MKTYAFPVFAIFGLFVLGCNDSVPSDSRSSKPASDSNRPTLTAIHYSTASIMKAVSDDQFDVFFPNPSPGQSPSDQEIDQMQSSSMIIISGKHQAGWIDTVTLPESKKYQAAGSILGDIIRVDNLGSHQHGPTGFHSHDGPVSETWLSPRLFQKQVAAISQQLVKREILSKDQAEVVRKNSDEIFSPLMKLAEKAKRPKSEKWLVDHAGSEYLCSDLNLDTTILELKEGFEKDPSALKKSLKKWVANYPSTGVVITQKQAPEVLELLSELKIKTVNVDLIHSGPDLEKTGKSCADDYVLRMKKNYANFGNFEEK